jgi:WD40 repeat protein
LLAGNERAISGSWDQSLRLWDVSKGVELGSFSGVVNNVRCLAVSPDGKIMAVSHFVEGTAPVGTLRLWNIASQKPIREFHGHAREISSVSFSADGKRLLTTSFDHTVRLWDVATGKEVQQLKCASRMESAVFVEGDRRVLCSGNEDDPTLQLWDVEQGTRILRSAPVEGGFLAVAALPGERRVVTAGRDGMIRFLQWKK